MYTQNHSHTLSLSLTFTRGRGDERGVRTGWRKREMRSGLENRLEGRRDAALINVTTFNLRQIPNYVVLPLKTII